MSARGTAARRFAALPMYDFPALHAVTDAFWSAIAARLRAAGVADVPTALTRDMGHVDTWRDPRLLLGQACQYPLAKSWHEAVQLLAIPAYAAPGCDGSRYRSAIIVRAEDPARRLEDLRGRRCAVNERDSNSGSNLLRAAIAPLARQGRFFSSVELTGGHLQSAQSVAAGTADVAAIDCVSYAHIGRFYSQLTARLRILDWTPSSPGLPYITARASDPSTSRHCEARSPRYKPTPRSRRFARRSCRAALISRSTRTMPKCGGSRAMRLRAATRSWHRRDPYIRIRSPEGSNGGSARMVAARRSPRISISKRARARLARKCGGHVALCKRALDPVTVAAGGDPADHLAAVPDRLIAEHVRIGCLDREAHAP